MVELKNIERSKSKFGASFGGKLGKTDFYTILYNDEPVGEVEFHPKKSEILSIYVNYTFRGKGIAKAVVDQLFDIYQTDRILAWADKTSFPFWRKIATQELPNDYFVIEKN
jgi:GNAT superfamily N-acetyltransferase